MGAGRIPFFATNGEPVVLAVGRTSGLSCAKQGLAARVGIAVGLLLAVLVSAVAWHLRFGWCELFGGRFI